MIKIKPDFFLDAQHFGGVCEIKGRIYKIGELFLDGCSYCVCKNDLSVNCNHKMCEHLHKGKVLSYLPNCKET